MDDLIAYSNKKSWEHIKGIYPSQLTVGKTSKLDDITRYLDLKASYPRLRSGKDSHRNFHINVFKTLIGDETDGSREPSVSA